MLKPTINTSISRTYDIIAFGDEVPGILSLVCAAREHFRRTSKYPRSLVLFKGNSQLGIGGHLVRGGLAYLDRSVVPADIKKQLGLGIYGDESNIYKEFLTKTEVIQVALDPRKADSVLRGMLSEVRADVLSNFTEVVLVTCKLFADGVSLLTISPCCNINPSLRFCIVNISKTLHVGHFKIF